MSTHKASHHAKNPPRTAKDLNLPLSQILFLSYFNSSLVVETGGRPQQSQGDL